MRWMLGMLAAGGVVGVLGACDTSTAPPTGGARVGSQSPFAEERRVVGGGGRSSAPAPEGVDVVNRLPFALVRGQTGDLEVVEERTRTWIVRGAARVPANQVADAGIDRVRRVEDIRVPRDVSIVFVDVSPASKYRGAAEGTAAPTLVDTAGERYMPVGWAYLDAEWADVRYEPGEPVSAMAQVPATSRSRTDQRLWLIYRVTFGRSVRFVAQGDKALFEFNPPVELTRSQGE
ncbi:MAG: hypothetical protein SFY69_09850 [Planctomycetota bacterium]|nr:hypothetical protein [Planctomycetota bacterium]